MQNLYHKIVFLTGAGISEESGLATFRDAEGLWNKYDAETVASLCGFEENPLLVHQFYNELRQQMFVAQPNPAHLAITYLQQKIPADIHVITQNIDTLHEKASTQNVWHIHGQINQLKCLSCGQIIETWGYSTPHSSCPYCQGKLRPNIVFFGEEILFSSQIENLLKNADLFVAVGTSGTIPPASSFVCEAKQHHALTVALNLERPDNFDNFDIFIQGRVSETLPLFVQDFF